VVPQSSWTVSCTSSRRGSHAESSASEAGPQHSTWMRSVRSPSRECDKACVTVSRSSSVSARPAMSTSTSVPQMALRNVPTPSRDSFAPSPHSRTCNATPRCCPVHRCGRRRDVQVLDSVRTEQARERRDLVLGSGEWRMHAHDAQARKACISQRVEQRCDAERVRGVVEAAPGRVDLDRHVEV
jgi:hypothetical protein